MSRCALQPTDYEQVENGCPARCPAGRDSSGTEFALHFNGVPLSRLSRCFTLIECGFRRSLSSHVRARAGQRDRSLF